MDGTNCRSPIGGGFGVWDQTWESNRAVRLENVGETDVINPWLSNGRNDFRSVKEIVAGAVRPGHEGSGEGHRALAPADHHRFHAGTGDNEVERPRQGLQRLRLHHLRQRFHLPGRPLARGGLPGAPGPLRGALHLAGPLRRALEPPGRRHGPVLPPPRQRHHRQRAGPRARPRPVKRTHTHGIHDPDSRAAAEGSAALFISESEGQGNRDSVRDTTMNMVLRPNEALVWRWGHVVPVKYHGRADIKVWGPRSDGGKVWAAMRRSGFATAAGSTARTSPASSGEGGGTGRQRQGGRRRTGARGREDRRDRLEDAQPVRRSWAAGSTSRGAGRSSPLSWDGRRGIEVDRRTWRPCSISRTRATPATNTGSSASCRRERGSSAWPSSTICRWLRWRCPGWPSARTGSSTRDQSTGARARCASPTNGSSGRCPGRPPRRRRRCSRRTAAQTDGTDIVFKWQAPADRRGRRIADYHFELSDRAGHGLAAVRQLRKADQQHGRTAARPRYSLPYVGLLTPGQKYCWHVRAKNDKGVWGPWSKTWSFTPGGPVPPLDVRLEAVPGNDGQAVLRWKPGTAGRKAVKYRVYGSDEKGFSVSDEPYTIKVGKSKDVPAQAPANFVAETDSTELVVLGAGVNLPNANKAYLPGGGGGRQGEAERAFRLRGCSPALPPQQARRKRPGSAPSTDSQVATIRSLGDLRLRIVEGKEAAASGTSRSRGSCSPRVRRGCAWTRAPACSAACRTPRGRRKSSLP